MPRWYRYDDYDDYKPTIRTDQGIRARGQTGKIGQSWWAKRWITALERLVDAGRLRRGRSYARSGQVLSIEEKGETITAKVQGSSQRPYKVTIALSPLSDEQWEQVIEQMANQAGFAAQLLAGDMPADIEDVFAAAGVSLFPDQYGDLETDCSCPDWANPCKHVAAAHYILGEQFDEDPFMLFRLRGRSQEQILEALRARRGGEGEEEEAAEDNPEVFAPLEEVIDTFWQPAERLDALAIYPRPPAVTLPLLKRLGPPTFLPDVDLAGTLAPVYSDITQAALKAAFGNGQDPEE